jgi:hypothetical protein
MGRFSSPRITRVRRTMARLHTPVPPLARHVDREERAEERAVLDDLDDQESLAKTVERKSVRITTARFASLAPCAVDVLTASTSAAASQPGASTSVPAAPSPWASLATTLLLHPRAAIGAAVWVACVIAGISGVLLGHSVSRPRAAAAGAAQTSRAPRTAYVVEAREEITEMPILAPGKVVDSPVAEATSAAARPLRRTGFGHLGADRVASGAGGRRAAPHRR